MILATPAYAQESTDPYAELGLIDESAPVAEEQTATEPAVEEVTEQTLLREHSRFVGYLEESNFDQADISAKRVIEMAIKLHGPQSHETAKALNNLAVVQSSTQQYDAAIQNFTAAIEIIENIEDRLNEELVNPLKGLGAAQLGNGRPDLASKTYGRATHITHVNDGPHNIDQVEILESLAEANVRLGLIDEARDVLDRIHILNVRHFSDDAMGLLPSLMRRAGWQHEAGYYNDERATYRRAIRIIEDSVGKEDPRLIDPLIKLGESFYYFEPMTHESSPFIGSSTGEVYLKRANRIAERSANFPWLERASTKLALADYYIFSSEYARAKNIYQEVWNDLGADDDRLAMRQELLGQPRAIWKESLPSATSGAAGSTRRDGEIRTGEVNVIYEITQRGRARIKEATVNPEEFTAIRRIIEREVKRRVYRPMLVDGTTVGSGPQLFRHEFKYSQTEHDDLRKKEEEKQQAASRQ
jgi:tetratricopeptide (TPR) repeat protein